MSAVQANVQLIFFLHRLSAMEHVSVFFCLEESFRIRSFFDIDYRERLSLHLFRKREKIHDLFQCQ